ncbi:MAG: hypothetical protein JKY27_07085 [Magnetovibrio sp.]|nr:hypothetical protein [Magnetovibrio sp.]
MSKRLNKNVWETNALVMGSGVGVATLEAMFNMVNTQSLLSANMVRDFELSHPLQLQALASALTQIIAASEYGSSVAVNFPGRKKSPDSDGEGGSEFGAVPDLDALKKLINGNGGAGFNQPPGSFNQPPTGPNSQQSWDRDKHMTELLELLREHLSDITHNAKQTLAVT